MSHCDAPTLEPIYRRERDPRSEEIEDRKACARSLVQKLIADLEVQNRCDDVLDDLIRGIREVTHDTVGEQG